MSMYFENISEAKLIKFNQSDNEVNKKPSFLARSINWLRASDEIESVKSARKALAIFVACLLTLTLIGIVPVILGALEWKSQEISLKQPLASNEIPQPVGKADLDIEKFNDYQFSSVEEETVLAKQEQIISVHPKYKNLSLAALQKQGLLPTNKIVIGDVSVYCSNIFKLNSGQHAAIALIEIDNQVFPRLIVHSNSQGTWRVIPYGMKGFQEGDEGFKFGITWFGKGQCETDTQLPIPVICALNNLSSHVSTEPNEAKNLVQTVKNKFVLDKLFDKQVQINQSVFLNEGVRPNWMVPLDPREVNMPKDVNLHPDFSEKVADFKQTIPHYGEVSVKIFASKDKSVLYMFYEMQDGRAFLASVECIQGVGINSFGVREAILELQTMDAPLLEYDQQIHPEFRPHSNENNYKSEGPYQNNWNYIRELEIIKMYYREQSKMMPEQV